MGAVSVLAIFTTTDGNLDVVIEHLRAIENVVRAENGCIGYEIAVDLDNASPTQAPLGAETFVVIEKWASLSDLKAHAASAHMARFSSATSDMITNKTVHILKAF